MNFHTRKWVKPEELKPGPGLSGGRLLQWIDKKGLPVAQGKTAITYVKDRF
jgi:acyl-CoA hydrolase